MRTSRFSPGAVMRIWPRVSAVICMLNQRLSVSSTGDWETTRTACSDNREKSERSIDVVSPSLASTLSSSGTTMWEG
ncbi:hypothetical protein BKA93DRAFT_765255 [Sparassis latifolia]